MQVFHLNFEICQNQFSTEQVISGLDKTTKFIRFYLRNLVVVFMLCFFYLLACFPWGNPSMYNACNYLPNLWICWQAYFLQAYKGIGVKKIKRKPCDKLCMGCVASLSFWWFRRLRTDYLCGDQLKTVGAGYIVEWSESN